jgi:Transcription factor zinc-finger
VPQFPLQRAALAGRRIKLCTQRQGMLVSMDDFVAVLEELRSQRSGYGSLQPAPGRQALQRRIDCPRCHQPMDTHFYEGPGNIIIDDCSRCSINWLDKGELMQVVRAPDHNYTEDTYSR